MTTRDDVNGLAAISARSTSLARQEFDRLFRSVGMGSPVAARDALLLVFPQIVQKYGLVAATAAAEWYDTTRAVQVASGMRVTIGETAPKAAVEGTVRYAAKFLFEENPLSAQNLLSGSLQRYVSYGSRDTVARNARKDRARPSYARVPSGAKTCAFCMIMASRGFVYASEESAGRSNDFHDDCDCQIVPEWDRKQNHIEGYDPDNMYKMYLEARKSSGSGDIRTVASELRTMHPDMFTDGHTHQ